MINLKLKGGILGLVALGALLSPTIVSASPGPESSVTSSSAPASQVVVHTVKASEQAAALKYWTKERMANARPVRMAPRTMSGSEGLDAAATAGEPGAVPPVSKTGKTANAGLVPTGVETPSTQGFSYPFPFTRTAVSPVSDYNHSARRVNGKIFFVQNGGNFVCSGTVVTSTNRNEVWTAGHCLSDGTQTFNSSTIFVPAYNGNSSTPAPFGQWTATQLVVSSEWHNLGNLKRDLGAFNVAPLSGVQIQNRVGAAGFAWNQSRNQQFNDLAYPAAAPFDGKSMQLCMAAYGASDTAIGGSGPAPTGIGCDMTGGSSGGSWQIRWGGTSGASAGYINGHNDYKYTSSQPLAMYSPYFDTLANTVRCAIQPAGATGCP